MKILIVSDTHGDNSNFYKVLKSVGKIDYLIHAGDIQGSSNEIINAADCPSYMVSGNNDFSFSLNKQELFSISGNTFLLVHGHKEGVYFGTDRLVYKAAELGANIVVYGHTHIPRVQYDEEYKIWIVNPGSLTYPRQAGHKPSYIILDINQEGTLDFNIYYLS